MGSTEGANDGASSPGLNEELPLVRRDGETIVDVDERVKKFLKYPFGENFDTGFWDEVSDLYTKSYADDKESGWSAALNHIRVQRLVERYEREKKDPVLALFIEVYDEYLKYVVDPHILSSFKHQLTEFVKFILHDARHGEKYKDPLPTTSETKKTVLHFAAERGLTNIVKICVEMYPNHVYDPTTGGPGLERLPLELAMLHRSDDTSSFLVKNMLHERVRELFESNAAFNARFKLADIINDPKMENTVLSILDCCVNADWPYVPVKQGERKEEAWSKMPDMPLRYHFYYRLLDGDQDSEPAKLKGTENPNFDHRTPSCLQLIAESEHSQSVISHPVIRMLVNKKWDLFGCRKIRFYFLLYVLFLTSMGFAFFINSSSADRRSYSSTEDYFRAVCEIITLMMTLCYFISELDQMEKERFRYLKDPYNYLDLIGLILILLIIPLRYTDNAKAEFTVAGLAFLFNCLRVFKYFPAFKQLGLYSKTFAKILYYDISKFALLYTIVMLAFLGCVFLSLKAVSVDNDKEPSPSFWKIFLKEIRTLTEGSPFDESYESFNVGIIILLMVNMFSIMVVLSNILIGQISERYNSALQEAEIQYSVDKVKFITKIEKSRFRTMNDRMTHYTEGDYVSDDKVVTDLLEDWGKLRTKKTDETKTVIKKMMYKVIQTRN